MNGENVQQNNLENIYSARLMQQRPPDVSNKSSTLPTNIATAKELASAAKYFEGPSGFISGYKKLSEHRLIISVALLFDIIDWIPWIGIITNPIFGLILFLSLGSKTKINGLKIAGLTVTGMAINSIPILNLLPTNLANAVMNILTKQ